MCLNTQGTIQASISVSCSLGKKVSCFVTYLSEGASGSIQFAGCTLSRSCMLWSSRGLTWTSSNRCVTSLKSHSGMLGCKLSVLLDVSGLNKASAQLNLDPSRFSSCLDKSRHYLRVSDGHLAKRERHLLQLKCISFLVNLSR